MRPNSVSHPKTRPMCVCLFALWECGNVHGWSSFLTSWYVHPVWRALFNIIFVVFFYLKTILTMWLAEYHITRFFFALYPKFTTTKLLKSMDNIFAFTLICSVFCFCCYFSLALCNFVKMEDCEFSELVSCTKPLSEISEFSGLSFLSKKSDLDKLCP